LRLKGEKIKKAEKKSHVLQVFENMEKGSQGDGEQGRVAVKREKEEEESDLAVEEEERKRLKLEVDEEARLNRALVKALLKGNASVVKSLVERGADLFFLHRKRHERTAPGL
jgi:hypothetical protein